MFFTASAVYIRVLPKYNNKRAKNKACFDFSQRVRKCYGFGFYDSHALSVALSFEIFAWCCPVFLAECPAEREGIVEAALFCKITNGGVGTFTLLSDEMRQPQFVEQG